MTDQHADREAVDPFKLNRFVEAQEGICEHVLAEIRTRQRRSHWMWFIFPQPDGLGFSATSKRYSIKSLADAEAYVKDPLLGPRLRECCEVALGVSGRRAFEIFGSPDEMKLRSSAR